MTGPTNPADPTSQDVDLSLLVHNVHEQAFKELDKIGLAGQRDQGLVCPLISPALSGSTDVNVSWGRILAGQHHLCHHHPDASEFYVVVAGTPTIHLGNKEFVAKPGDAVYIPTGTIHGITNKTAEPVDLVVGMSVPANWTFVPDE
ncbi:cupin domain-containing protein [Streptomyces sp. NPDC056821]|uniref:cupin domain-containing protein n=1 Tax=unclassified Streptomyces TaxID=2593676 RepID=UPI0036925B5D